MREVLRTRTTSAPRVLKRTVQKWDQFIASALRTDGLRDCPQVLDGLRPSFIIVALEIRLELIHSGSSRQGTDGNY